MEFYLNQYYTDCNMFQTAYEPALAYRSHAGSHLAVLTSRERDQTFFNDGNG